MNIYKFNHKQFLFRLILMTISSICIAAGFNLLLIPVQLLSGGLSGVAMLIGYITNSNIGWLLLVLNLPILIWGWFTLGRQLVFWSIYSVISTTFLLQTLPIYPLADDILLASVYGGILVGFASGLALRCGGSTGGFDIIASIITLRRDLPIGMILLALNAAVIAFLIVFTKDWELALYSLVAIFCVGKIIDIVHVKHLKVTAFIITTKSEEMLSRLLSHPRGITIIKTRGAFTSDDRDMLMTVRTRYELAELTKTIQLVDKHAFVTIVETVGVMGEFGRLKGT